MAFADEQPRSPRAFEDILHSKRKALEYLEHHPKLVCQWKEQNRPRFQRKGDDNNYVLEGGFLSKGVHPSHAHGGLEIYSEDPEDQWKMYVFK